MCGINGIIGFDKKEKIIEYCNTIQKHRGPDNQGVWNDDYIALSHQRLSIIDLSNKSNQPFQKNNFVIVFNGEIYNYKYLKKKITQEKKVRFKTESDTEVVLEMFINYGEKCLEYFEGMFSFAIFNQENKSLFMARDHFGIKPFFYYKKGNKFAFSSELKSLASIEDIKKEVNYKALISSINYLWVSGNETMFKDCFKLPPAHYMILNKDGELKLKKYWSLNTDLFIKDEKTIIGELDDIINDSIRRHLISDVEVCSFLSGGLDSSLISVLAKENLGNLKTFTIGTEKSAKNIEKMPDDEKYARKLSKKYGFEGNEIIIKPNIIEYLPKIVRTLDEPIGDPAAINTYLICENARKKGIKVLLSGMGADEIFGGYRRQYATLLGTRYKMIPEILRRNIIEKFVDKLPVKIGNRGIKTVRWAKRFLNFASLPLDESYMRSYSYYNKEELFNLFLNNNSSIENLYMEHNEIFNSSFQNDIVNKMCYTDINMFMTGLNLTYSDRASMAASVEIRVPFIDKKLIEYAMRIPGKFKIKNGISKYILKKVAEKHLPKEIIYRPKASFGAPIRAWISNDLKNMVDDLLSKNNIEKRNIFDYRNIKRIIENDRKGIEDNAYQIYQLLTLELWFREFFD